MSFIKLFGNKIRAKDVVYKNGKSLDDTREWKKVDVGNAGGFKTITVDLSQYSELLLTVGTYPINANRILASTVIPISDVVNQASSSGDGNGHFQAYYSSTYWAGFNYLGNNQIQYRSSSSSTIAFLWAR